MAGIRGLVIGSFMLVGAASCVPATFPTGDLGPQTNPELAAFFADPRLAHAQWGALFQNLTTGETLFALNPDRVLVPASNAKLVAGAAALEALGPGYRFTTTLSASGERRDGVLNGSLIVTGTGDPTFSGRFLEDPRDAFRSWADSLRNRGITRVVGGVIAVDTAFSGPTLGAGWMWDDLDFGASAEYGALQFNEGTVHLDVFPSQNVLDPAVTVLTPPTQYVRVINDTRTMAPGSNTAVRVTRDEAGPAILVEGEVASEGDGYERTVAVRNPSLFFASVLRETLREEGISIEGPAAHFSELGLMSMAMQGAFPLFTYQSPPLEEILPAMMKPSQNQIAETLLYAMGREERGVGSATGGVAVIDSLFTIWGLGDLPYRLEDASGLSRYDLLSPELLVGILRAMDRSPFRDVWYRSLAISGTDGTLENRMRDDPLVGRVRAKTGTMSGIRSLSGYLETARGDTVVFSTIVNNSTLSSSVADEIVEAALARIAQDY